MGKFDSQYITTSLEDMARLKIVASFPLEPVVDLRITQRDRNRKRGIISKSFEIKVLQ